MSATLLDIEPGKVLSGLKTGEEYKLTLNTGEKPTPPEPDPVDPQEDPVDPPPEPDQTGVLPVTWLGQRTSFGCLEWSRLMAKQLPSMETYVGSTHTKQCLSFKNTNYRDYQIAQMPEGSKYYQNAAGSQLTFSTDAEMKKAQEQTKKCMEYIDSELAAKRPVIVGMTYKISASPINADNITDHYVLVIGNEKTAEGTTYTFHDPGTATKSKGEKLKMKLNSRGFLSGKNYKSMPFEITAIVPNVPINKAEGDPKSFRVKNYKGHYTTQSDKDLFEKLYGAYIRKNEK